MTLSKRRILSTEDDADTRELIRVALSAEGYEVVTAQNPTAAVFLARSDAFDLYIVDNWLPGVSGDELTRRIREFDSETPILIYSGRALDSDRESALASGAQAYLVKPASIPELLGEVARLIGEAGDQSPVETKYPPAPAQSRLSRYLE